MVEFNFTQLPKIITENADDLNFIISKMLDKKQCNINIYLVVNAGEVFKSL